ncbi:hypothetical protein ACMGDH_16750 [Sphingomonas sp. DT-207]|uniref:hypothetical protein n=1 Tax=Sphingomonas sp. DT-207 TaxID=3396167 RepID=UPI003F19E267
MNLPVVPVPAVPFGVSAALIALALAGVAAVVWRVARKNRRAMRKAAGEPPVLRRADAHPDAPSRPPLLAMRDLGTPFLEIRASETRPVPEAPVPIERALPRDLSQPLAAFDPGAIRDAPLAAPAKLPSLRPRPRDERITRPETEASIHALLDRLERGMVRRGLATGMERTPAAAHRSPSDHRRTERALEDSLATFRNFARSA